jgi:hypothetical protein
MFVCLYVCVFVCLYLIQIHISEPIGTKLCTRLPLGLEETVGYVWARNSGPPWSFRPFFLSEHKMVDGEPVFRDTLISVVPAGVRVTSPTLRYRSRRSHPRQSYIRDSSGSFPYVIADDRVSATASYPLFWWVFASCHGYYVQPGGGPIRHRVISLILAPVFVAYRKSRPCERQLCVPTPSVLRCR